MSLTTPRPYQSPLRRLTGVQIVATGSYVPETVVTNEELAKSFGFDADWILQRTGIRERRLSPPDWATSDLAFEAGANCISKSGIDPRQIDLLLVATATPDVHAPATACIVQDRLGLNCAAVDVSGACSGFVYALVTAMQYAKTGCSQMALVVGADCMSRVLNPRDQRTYPLFGDGAGAVLVSRGTDEQGLLSYTLGSDGSGAPLLVRRMGGSRYPASAELMQHDEQYLYMDGRAIFKWALNLFDDTVPGVLAHAGLSVDQIDLWVLHQANQRIVAAIAENLHIDPARMFMNLDRYGNTTGGSIPLALDEAVSSGLVSRGNKLVLSGFGAGLAWGTAVLKW